jgi:DNA repair exonuclease SbcCD ATPase subunit
MENMNDILNPPQEQEQETRAEVETTAETETDDTVKGEEKTTRVAAEETEVQPESDPVKAELSALAKERERIRKKEAALDEELARVNGGGSVQQEPAAAAATATVPEIATLEARMAELQDKADDIFQESGPTEERKALLAEINKINRQIVKLDVQQEQSQERRQNEVATSLQTVAATAYTSYPFLDKDSPDADIDAIDAVRNRRDQLISEGKSPAEALRAAVDEKGPKFAKILGVAVSTPEDDASLGQEPADERTAVGTRTTERLARGGFSEVRSVGKSQTAGKSFSGPTPMTSILGKG